MSSVQCSKYLLSMYVMQNSIVGTEAKMQIKNRERGEYPSKYLLVYDLSFTEQKFEILMDVHNVSILLE